ncbi:hypothetical protein QL285_013348 [Trifolium repens]|nr:hypothetical protein QL285_013348 [Trifolium repens]
MAFACRFNFQFYKVAFLLFTTIEGTPRYVLVPNAQRIPAILAKSSFVALLMILLFSTSEFKLCEINLFTRSLFILLKDM